MMMMMMINTVTISCIILLFQVEISVLFYVVIATVVIFIISWDDPFDSQSIEARALNYLLSYDCRFQFANISKLVANRILFPRWKSVVIVRGRIPLISVTFDSLISKL